MHYIFIIATVLLVCLAYGGHSQTFAQAFKAATEGEAAEALDLFSTAMKNTLRDADTSPRETLADQLQTEETDRVRAAAANN